MCSSHIQYTCACGCLMHSAVSRASFSRMLQAHQTVTSQPRFNNIWCLCDVLSSASAWNQFFFYNRNCDSDFVFTLWYSILSCSVTFLFYISCSVTFCTHSCLLSQSIHHHAISTFMQLLPVHLSVSHGCYIHDTVDTSEMEYCDLLLFCFIFCCNDRLALLFTIYQLSL